MATFEGADGRCRVIDDDGRVLDVLDSQPVDYLLVLSAGRRRRRGAGQFAPQGFGAAAGLVAGAHPELRARAQSVAVDARRQRPAAAARRRHRGALRRGEDLVDQARPPADACSTSSTAAAAPYIDVSTNEVTTGDTGTIRR